MQAHEFTLYDMLSRNALIYGDRPAVIHAGRLTFRDFLSRVDALAAGLAALPLAKGERLCILAQNHPAYLELYGACARLGVMAYPINWRLTAEEIGRIVERAAPRRCWSMTAPCHSWPIGHVPERLLPPGTPWAARRRQASLLRDAVHTAGELGPCVVAPDDPFAVSPLPQWTSCRVGVLTHTNLLMANLQTMACMGLTEADVNLLALPCFTLLPWAQRWQPCTLAARMS